MKKKTPFFCHKYLNISWKIITNITYAQSYDISMKYMLYLTYLLHVNFSAAAVILRQCNIWLTAPTSSACCLLGWDVKLASLKTSCARIDKKNLISNPNKVICKENKNERRVWEGFCTMFSVQESFHGKYSITKASFHCWMFNKTQESCDTSSN